MHRFEPPLRFCGCRDHCRRVLEFSLLHGLAVGLTWLVIFPVQSALLGGSLTETLALMPVLLFLPAVIKALAAWMYGWWAVIYVMPTALAQHVILGGILDWAGLVTLTIYLSAASIVISVMKLMEPDFAIRRRFHAWRLLILITFLASILQAIIIQLPYLVDMTITEFFIFLSMSVVGDVAGGTLTLLALLALFRMKERLRLPVRARHQA